jgi:hypothetical protein
MWVSLDHMMYCDLNGTLRWNLTTLWFIVTLRWVLKTDMMYCDFHLIMMQISLIDMVYCELNGTQVKLDNFYDLF